MTPAARYSAAIEVLDTILAGTAAEKALTAWARSNRYAGSKDRAAVRDHVYDVLRAQRSLAGLGGGETGRLLILGLLRRDGTRPETVFGAGGYGPEALSVDEVAATGEGVLMSQAASCDVPDWLWPTWKASLGEAAESVAKAQQLRAPVHLRVNQRRTDVAAAVTQLADDQVKAQPHPKVKTALQVTENARRVKLSQAYLNGDVELQDAASQQAMLSLEIAPGAQVLDYCAGGGGKALALADLYNVSVTAHDISTARMSDIPVRAARAGVSITIAGPEALSQDARFDLVLCDAPCSGSGTWRRNPDAKWRLTPDNLIEYNAIQADVLAAGAKYVKLGGTLVYATCSVLACENDDVVNAFCAAHAGWTQTKFLRLTPSAYNDGFFLVALSCSDATLT